MMFKLFSVCKRHVAPRNGIILLLSIQLPKDQISLHILSIVYNEFRICLQESYVITLIIFTRVVFVYFDHWNFWPYEKDETTFCVFLCLNVVMTPLCGQWRHHACWYTWVWYKECSENIDWYIPTCTKEIYRSFCIRVIYYGITGILSWYCCFYVSFIFMILLLLCIIHMPW